jgi:hypothetical protein
MGAAEMIHTLESLGISVQAEGSKLLLEPGSLVPADLIPQIRLYKSEILELLAAPDPSDDAAARLIAWARELAEQCMVLSQPVTFVETPLRTITTVRVSHHASVHLRTLAMARTNQVTGGWGRFTREWWQGQEKAALHALAALREAMEQVQDQETHS